MWTLLRTFLERDGDDWSAQPYQGDAGGLNWQQVAENQRLAVVRRGGILNLTAQWPALWLWLGCCFIAWQQQQPMLLFVPATLSLACSLGLFRRYRLMVDTPTSRLHSSAQGYVELQGTVALPPQEASRGLPHLPPTVWLPGYIEDQPFLLDDGYGQCWLYPEQAEIVLQRSDSPFAWLQAIYPGQTVYVLGELQTQRGADWQRRERLAALLAEWKYDAPQLLRNFDANGNGEIDTDEWQTVRAAAERLVDEELREAANAPGKQVMDSARPGQLFLITNVPPERLAQRYRWAAFAHLLFWLGVLCLNA